MRVLYVAPRFHTNQVPVIRGWLSGGHQVMFISQFQSITEDYSVLKPVILGYWKPVNMLIHAAAKVRYRSRYTLEKEYAIKVKAGFPPIRKMKQHIEEFRPDVMILRERSVYNIPFYQFARKHKIPCILYNQSPLWDDKNRDCGLGHRLLLRFLPKVRMTPVLGKSESGNIKMKDSYYVPFVIEPRVVPDKKRHFENGRIHVLCVGRYEKRKNLFLLLDTIKELSEQYPLILTIIGEVTDQFQEEYYDRLHERVQEYRLDEIVRLLKNLNIEEMYGEYERADLFVLPSTKERASVSQLEAMSCSVPVICSDTNGTACYVINGKNGFLFRDMDGQDLKEKIEKAVSDREKLIEMGRISYYEVIEKYQFSNYYQNVLNIINSADCF